MNCCDICGSSPCASETFCNACRQADAGKCAGRPPLYIDSWNAKPSRLNSRPAANDAKPFTFDAAAVLQAVAVMAEHAVAGTATPSLKAAWAREHTRLFKFPPVAEIADHITRVAAYSMTVEKTVLNVLGAARIKAGLAAQKEKARS